MTQNPRPATGAEIIEIVGPLEDAVLMRIIETGATPAEVLEASLGLPPMIRSARSWNGVRAASSRRSTKSSSWRNRNRTNADRRPAALAEWVIEPRVPG